MTTDAATESTPASVITPATAPAGKPLVVGLVAAPLRSLAIAAFLIVFGTLLLVKFSTVAQVVGVVLLVAGAITAALGALAAVFPPGRIVLDDETVTLPRRVSRRKHLTYPRTAIRAAYFLRSSTPWLRASPVLVIEAGDQAHLLPRDWFATEADQRRILDALAVTPVADAAA